MQRNRFSQQLFSSISKEDEELIKASPEVDPAPESYVEMDTGEIEDPKDELVELEGHIEDGYDNIEECESDQECLRNVSHIVQSNIENENGLETETVEIINATVENIFKRHGLKNHRFKVPSLERYGEPLNRVKQAKVALEGIGDVLDFLKNAIVMIWEKIWGFIKKVFTKTGQSTKASRGALSEALKAAKGAGDKFLKKSNLDSVAEDKFYTATSSVSDVAAALLMDLNLGKTNNEDEIELNLDDISKFGENVKKYVKAYKSADFKSMVLKMDELNKDELYTNGDDNTAENVTAIVINKLSEKIYGGNLEKFVNTLKGNEKEIKATKAKCIEVFNDIPHVEKWVGDGLIDKIGSRGYTNFLVEFEEKDFKVDGKTIANERLNLIKAKLHAMSEEQQKGFKNNSSKIEGAIAKGVTAVLQSLVKLSKQQADFGSMMAKNIKQQCSGSSDKK